jgi:multidrug efflux pump subunit AcrA (membrane-fusion protein)
MTANVSIITSAKENALLVPLEAIRDLRGKKYVTVKNGTETTQKEVTVGVVNTDSADVLTGLNEGDTIIMQLQGTANTNNNQRIPGMGGGIMGGGGNYPQGGGANFRQQGTGQTGRQGQ